MAKQDVLEVLMYCDLKTLFNSCPLISPFITKALEYQLTHM